MKGEGVSKENGTARIGTKSKLKHWREREGKAAEEKELKKVCVSTKKQIPRKILGITISMNLSSIRIQTLK